MPAAEQGLNKNEVIAILTRSPHGDLAQYVPLGVRAAAEDPDFYAHLIAWNAAKGTIRDAKIALPVIALTAQPTFIDDELRDNALAHILKLDPRSLAKAVRFSKSQPLKDRRQLALLVEQYLRDREAQPARFDRIALQHRNSLHELYALLHVKPSEHAQQIIFERKKLGIFADVVALKDMAPDEIAGTIMRRRIPFLVAAGALGAKAKDPAVVQALIGAMSPTELVTNMKRLERLGVKENPALRAALESALQKASSSKTATLKTTRAAEAVGGTVGEKLKGMQEKQLDIIAVEGDWIVICDKSGSMHEAIEVARHIAGFLARVAKGTVHLVFVDTSPQYFNVTGKDYDAITELTKRMTAAGGTSLGCGLNYATKNNLLADGVVLISDGEENAVPWFADEFVKYQTLAGKELPLYFYRIGSGYPLEQNMKQARVAMQVFALQRGSVDYYSLPNFAQQMRTNQYSLLDEIMATPLLRLADVLKNVDEVAAQQESEHA